MITLTGSRAIKYWFPDFREPKDWDWQRFLPGDVHDAAFAFGALPGEHNDVFVDPRLAAWPWGAVATPDELYTMKISHGYWDLHGSWQKHAADIVFLQRHGAQFIPELHDLLLAIWKERYPANRISLDKTAEEFFNDHVKKVYVHDTIHESVAYRDHPWYVDILKDGSEVLVDNSKFWALPLEDKLVGSGGAVHDRTRACPDSERLQEVPDDGLQVGTAKDCYESFQEQVGYFPASAS